MPLTAFNLEKLIREYNRSLSSKERIKIHEDFGFQSLSQDSFQTLLNTKEQFINAPRLFAGLSGKSEEEFKIDFADAIQQGNKKRWKDTVALYRADIQKQRNQKWLEDQQKRLSIPGFWRNLAGRFKNKIHHFVSQLQTGWQRQQDYAHYPSTALKQVAETILPLFDQYLELAHFELQHQGKHLPKPIRSAFKHYLVQLKLEIHHERQKCCWAMLARLNVASKSDDLQAGDVTMGLVKVLQSIRIIKRSARLPEERKDLTPACFQFFHRFIETHGTENIKTRLKHLAWFREDDVFVTLKRSSHHLIVPKILTAYVPDQNSELSTLFQGHTFRYQFFRDRLSLMSRLRWLDKQDIRLSSLKTLIDDPSWKSLNELEQELRKEYDNADKPFKSSLFNRLFRSKTQAFITDWKSFLWTQLQIILDKKRQFLHQVILHLRSCLDLHLDAELIHSMDFKQSLQSLARNVGELRQALLIDDDTVPELSEFKWILEEISNPESIHPTRSLEEMVFPTALQNQRVPDVSSTQPIPYDIEKAHQFLKQCEEKSLLENSQEDPNFIHSFEQCFNFVKQSRDLSLKAGLKEILERDFVGYLNECIKGPEADWQKNVGEWKAVEHLFLHSAPKSVRSRMTALCDLASKHQWDLWKIKCDSYLYSFNPNSNLEGNLALAKESICSVKEKSISDHSSFGFFHNHLRDKSIDQIPPESLLLVPNQKRFQ